ncbi:MAG: hypothetical protein ACTSR3_05875 [Candidatus Helarchaeota archaeon]
MKRNLEKEIAYHMTIPALEGSLLGVLYDVNSPIKRVRDNSRKLARHYLKVLRKRDEKKYKYFKFLYEKTIK